MQCPDCGATVAGVRTYAPDAHAFDPCGCRTDALTAHDMALLDRGRGVATDGGTEEATERCCPDCGSTEIGGEDSYGDTVCHSCGWFTEQGGPDEEVDWQSLHEEAAATTDADGRCRAISRSANRRCHNPDGHGPRGELCATHARETDPVTIDSDPRTLVKTVSPTCPARCRAIQYDGERCETGCGPTDRFCALHKTISLPEVTDLLAPSELDTVLVKNALSSVEQTDDARLMTDGGVVDSAVSAPASARLEVTDREVTWHTSEVVYEHLENHPSGNLVAEIEADVSDRDGSDFEIIVAPSGSFWVLAGDSR